MGDNGSWHRRALGWFRTPRDELPRWQRRVRTPLDVAWRAGRNTWWRDHGSQVADALAFRTIFSLLPMLVVMLSVVQAFRGVEYFQSEFTDDIIEFVLPDKLRGAETSAPPAAIGDEGAGEGAEEGAEGEAAAARREYQQARQQLGERIRSVVQDLSQINFGGLGAIGLLLFIYGATGLLGIIEQSFNEILGVTDERSIGQRLVLYYTIITLGPVVIAAGQMVRARALDVLTADIWGGWTDWLLGPAAVVTPLLTSWLVFLAMFQLLPSTRVRFGPAAIGALVASILWAAGREAFGLYAGTTAISSVYGAVALVPVFLLWIWLSWLIILFGLEVAEVLQTARQKGWEEEDGSGQRPLVEAAWLVPLTARLAAAFEEGETCDVTTLARAVGVAPRDCRRLLDTLTKEGVARREGEETPRYGLGRPADRIAVADLLRIGREHLVPATAADGSPPWRLVGRLKEAEAAAAEGATVQDLVRRAEADGGPERGAGNRERGTGNGERGTENGERRTGNASDR